jgi:hypothetical protein
MIIKLSFPDSYTEAFKPRCEHHLSDIYQRPRNQSVRYCKRFAVYGVNGTKLCYQHAASLIFDQALVEQESVKEYIVSIENVNKLELLKALYVKAKPRIPDFSIDRYVKKDLDDTYAELILKNSFERKCPFIDFIQDCPIMIDFTAKDVDTYAYDFYNGEGAFKEALETLNGEIP